MPFPTGYAFTNAHMFKGEFEPQTVVAVDVASVQLFGENNGMTQFSRHVDLCIDHHAGNSGYADFTLLDGSAAAAAELLYEVINAMALPLRRTLQTAFTPALQPTPAASGSLPPRQTPTLWRQSSLRRAVMWKS